MNLNRIVVVLVVLITGIFVAAVGSFAAKGGKGGGKPPPPPTACAGAGADTFPGFSYEVEARRKTPAEIHLASTDGCRSELVAVVSDLRSSALMHMTADGSKGILLWREDPGNTEHYIIQRQDFTVAANGALSLDPLITLLPLAGEEAPAEDYLYYFSMDIWGDATHDSLYLAITRLQLINATPSTADEAIKELLIYNLNDTDDVREIYLTAQDAGEWDCPSDPDIVPYPQYFPTCYRPQGIRFNPSGTRLYFEDNINDRQGQRWDAALRMNIGRVDLLRDPLPLDNWTFSAPELVYTGSGDQTAGGMLARPSGNPYIAPSEEEPSSAEYIAIRHTDRTEKNTLRTGDLLDADTCVDKYVIYADGTNNSPGNFLWGECLDTGKFFAAFNHGGGDSWQSPEALLTSTLGNRGFYDIYRRYVTGGSAGTEEILIEHARGADNGF